MSTTVPTVSSTIVPNASFFTLPSTGGLPTSQQEFYQQWLAAMQTQFPGYSPAPGNPENVQALIFSSWAADVAQLCTAGSTELFRQFGVQLLALPYEAGTPALAVLTVNAVDDAGYTLPALSQLSLTLAGTQVGFQTLTTLTIASGSTSGAVTVGALSAGTAFNGATNPAAMVSQIDWISSVSVQAAASGGVDQEDDDQYLNRLAATLQLLTPRPITASDFAAMALNFQPAIDTDQEEVGRATSIDGYDPAVTSFTGTTNGTTTVSAVSSFTGISVGSVIAATDITAGQTVVAVNPTAGTLTLSAAATGSHSGEAMTATGSFNNERCVTTCVTDASGNALNSDTMTAVQAFLESLRETNFLVFVIEPTYTNIYVAVTVGAVSGFTAAQIQANVQTSVLNLLTPANFGLPQGATSGWNNQTTLYISQVEAAIQNTAGVAFVQSGSLKVDTASTPTNTSDLVIPGPFPMPQTSVTTVPTSAITVLT